MCYAPILFFCWKCIIKSPLCGLENVKRCMIYVIINLPVKQTVSNGPIKYVK